MKKESGIRLFQRAMIGLSLAVVSNNADSAGFDIPFQTGFDSIALDRSDTLAVATSGQDVFVADFKNPPPPESPTARIYKWSFATETWEHFFLAHVEGKILTMAASGSSLFVGGSFDLAFSTFGGGTWVSGLNNVAKLNLTTGQWTGLAGGVTGGVPLVRTIKVSPNTGFVYVGGNFVNAGSLVANHIAKWTGTSWEALQAGVTEGVYQFAEPVEAIFIDSFGMSDELIVGGDFTITGASGGTAYNLANWSDFQHIWYKIGLGIRYVVSSVDPGPGCTDHFLDYAAVYDLAKGTSGGNIYIVGTFNYVNGTKRVIGDNGCPVYGDINTAKLSFQATGSTPSYSLTPWYLWDWIADTATVVGATNRFVGSNGFRQDTGTLALISSDQPTDMAGFSGTPRAVYIVGPFPYGAKRFLLD